MKISETENLIVVGVATVHIEKLRIKNSIDVYIASSEVQERNANWEYRN